MTPKLFYGATSREVALRHSQDVGTPIQEPIDATGLSIDSAREIVSLLSSAIVMGNLGTLVIGPLDDAKPQTFDALLKTLEEPPQDILVILYAADIGNLPSTLVSRCQTTFIEGAKASIPTEAVQALYTAMNVGALYLLFDEIKKNDKPERDFLEAFFESLPIQKKKKFWPIVRKAMLPTKLTRASLVHTLLQIQGQW